MKADVDQRSGGAQSNVAGLTSARSGLGASIVRSRLFFKYTVLFVAVVVLALLTRFAAAAAGKRRQDRRRVILGSSLGNGLPLLDDPLTAFITPRLAVSLSPHISLILFRNSLNTFRV
jgi:hypothetical protein